MPRKKLIGPCKIEGCDKPLKTLGMCANHYARHWKYGRTHLVNTGEKRSHPLYHFWSDRVSCRAPEWDDFWCFVKDVSPKPEGDFFLVRLNGDHPYGPLNFKWQPHLKRQEGETKKEWWARRWQARHANNRSIERDRWFKKRYGVEPERVAEMKVAQNNKCAICGNEETSYEPKTGSRRSLSLDHCHKTGKIRELLCWRCNGSLGKMEESIPLLEAMIAYIRKHGD